MIRRGMWNRVTGEKGFDADAVLPYRERLIILFRVCEHHALGEAYVTGEGEWHWWGSKVRIASIFEIRAWTVFPGHLLEELSC